MKNTVIFDLDGTLLYTLEDIMDSVNDALSKFNLPTITIEQTLSYVGRGAKSLMEQATKLPAGEEFDKIASLKPSFLSLIKSSSSPS